MSAHIMIVDPNLEACLQFSRLLEKNSAYTITTCTSGEEAIRNFRSHTIDVVLLEIELGDMNGAELTRVLIEEYASEYLPVIAVTSHGTIMSSIGMFREGASDYLFKPFHVLDLINRIEHFLEKKRSSHVISEDSGLHTVYLRFDFPESIKFACKQYLLYFVEFLRDIGIDATSGLREDAGQVFFSVTPKDKDEALDNIREALAIYLRLPMSRNTTIVVSPETSIESQKLSAQLHHLQGQLYLASAALQQKELTIQQQGTTIHYQQSLIEQQIASGQVLVQALQKEAEDAEPVGGIVKVKAWSVEGIPIELDLPTLMRMLKERFKRKRLE